MSAGCKQPTGGTVFPDHLTPLSVLSTLGSVLQSTLVLAGGGLEGQEFPRGTPGRLRRWAVSLEDPPSAANGHLVGEIQLDGKVLLPP